MSSGGVGAPQLFGESRLAMLQGRVREGLQAVSVDGVLVAVDRGEPWVDFTVEGGGGGVTSGDGQGGAMIERGAGSVGALLRFEHWAVRGAVGSAERYCVRDLLAGGVGAPREVAVVLGDERTSGEHAREKDRGDGEEKEG